MDNLIKILLLVLGIFSQTHADRRQDFLMPLTHGTDITDTNIYADNAQFFIAANFYDKKIGNVQGSYEKNGDLFIIIGKDSVPAKKFQTYCMKAPLHQIYVEEALALIKEYHNFTLMGLFIKGGYQDFSYIDRIQKFAEDLGVAWEFKKIKPKLDDFMKEIYTECKKNPEQCKDD